MSLCTAGWNLTESAREGGGRHLFRHLQFSIMAASCQAIQSNSTGAIDSCQFDSIAGTIPAVTLYLNPSFSVINSYFSYGAPALNIDSVSYVFVGSNTFGSCRLFSCLSVL